MSVKLCINNYLQIDTLGKILDFKCFSQCIGTGLHHSRAEAPGFTSRALNYINTFTVDDRQLEHTTCCPSISLLAFSDGIVWSELVEKTQLQNKM